MNDSLFTVRETAKVLKVHWQTVRTYILSGKLPAIRIGRHIRVRPEDLESFVEGQRITATVKPPQTPKRLVVVADDFGATKGVNEGICRSYEEGIVTEISLMMDYPGSKDALRLIRERKFKDVGIHAVLVGWGEKNRSLRREDYIDLFMERSEAEIENMAQNELKKFEASVGFKPTHIIPQYGIHGNLKLLKFILRYAKENKIAVRIPKSSLQNNFSENYAAEIMLRRSGVKTTDYLFGHVLGADIDKIKRDFVAELTTLTNGQSAEMLTHPGYFDEEILKQSTLNFERVRDLALCLDLDFRTEITNLGFHFVSYSQL